jgi:hypothetical protein
MVNGGPCYFCGSTQGTTWCGACQKYFCPTHRTAYGQRATGALSELVGNIKKLFGGK